MNENQIALSNDARVLNLCDNLIFPYLQQEKLAVMSKISMKYREGKQDFTAEAAYLTALENIEGKLKRTQNQGNKVLAEIQGANTNGADD